MWIHLDDTLINPLRNLLEHNLPMSDGDVASVLRCLDRPPGDARYLAFAHANLQRDGELEFDDDAIVSEGDDPGAYVMSWTWVYADDAGVTA